VAANIFQIDSLADEARSVSGIFSNSRCTHRSTFRRSIASRARRFSRFAFLPARPPADPFNLGPSASRIREAISPPPSVAVSPASPLPRRVAKVPPPPTMRG
jgi:hypothetical protein